MEEGGNHISKLTSNTLKRTHKWKVYLIHPLVMSSVAYVTLFLMEGVWPDWASMWPLILGFFTGHFIIAWFFPEKISFKRTKNPTKKQKVGQIILYTMLIGGYSFLIIRFFVRL